MAVFRIEKTQNYTVMSNHHLRNKTLTLKSKGLLSQMLSLPENWDYTLAGLSHINRESVDAIRSAVQELEQAGYITRSRARKENGQLGGAEYIIHEQPPECFILDNTTSPISDPPTQSKPILENPTQANSALGKPMQLSKDISKKEKTITDLSSTDSIPFHSPRVREDRTDRNGKEAKSMSAFEIYREIIQDNIEYPFMVERYPYNKDQIDEIVDLMLETVCTARKTIRIAGDDYPAELVKSKFMKLHSGHFEYVMECLKNNTTEIRNIKKYLLAVLFNAPTTMDSYYTALVAHDMASGKLFGAGKED
jgi:hypothetical protein